MSKKWFTQAMAILGMCSILAVQAFAGYIEAQDVQSRVGDPSPSQADSQINNYLYQDEQLNLSPSDGLVKILRTDQKVLTNDFVTELIPIKNVAPREIRNVMRQVTAIEGGRAEVIRDKTTGDNFVQVMAPAYMIPFLREAVAALDVKWLAEYNDGSTDAYIKMKHRPAAAVDSIAANYAGDEGFSTIDSTNNAVRRLDEGYRNEKYAAAVQMLDIPWNQVDLEVKVYEVNVNNDLKLGVDYLNWTNGPGRNLFNLSVGGYSAEQRSKNLSSIYDPFIDARGFFLGLDGLYDAAAKKQLIDTAARESYRSINYLLPSSYVDFLQAKGQAKVVSSQSLTVRSGATGVISNLDTIANFVVNENDATVEPDSPPVHIVRQNAGTWFIDINGNKKLDDVEVNIARLVVMIIQGLHAATGNGYGFGLTVDPITGDIGIDVDSDGVIDTNNLIMALHQLQLQGPINDIQEIIKAFNDGIEASENISLFLAPGVVRVKDYSRRVNYQNAGTVGMRLEVTPYVGLESMEMVMDLDIGELNGFAPNGTPIINTRTVSTTVRLLDGQPYAIAALKAQHDIDNSGKAPFLGDVPVVGYLFGGETALKRNDELVVTVTPRFRLSSQASIATPAKIQTMQLTVDREKTMGSSVNQIGFDQWLFADLIGL